MATSSLAVTSDKFKDFLVSSFNFEPFKRYLIGQRGFSLDFFLANTSPVDYISTGFDWFATDEGFNYWREVNLGWLKELKSE